MGADAAAMAVQAPEVRQQGFLDRLYSHRPDALTRPNRPWFAESLAPSCSPLCCSSLATSAVQPVWWLAPTPAPVSPWKYSWNGIRSRQCGSSLKTARPPNTGRRPSASAQEDAGQAPRELGGDLATASASGPTGRALDLEVVAEVVVELLQRLRSAGS